MVIIIGWNRTPPPPDSTVVLVDEFGRVQSAPFVDGSCCLQRRSSDVRPVEAKRIIKTIDRSANNQPASEETDRLDFFLDMVNSTEARRRFRGSVPQIETLPLSLPAQLIELSRQSRTSFGQFVTSLPNGARVSRLS